MNIKKFIRITSMIIALIISLAGCGEKSAEAPPAAALEGEYPDQIYADMEEWEIQEAVMIAAKITITTEFEMLLDENERIIAVKYLNQDAAAFYQELDLLGKTYEEGFEYVLKEAIEKDLVKDGSQIQVMMNGMKSEITFEDLDRMAGRSQAVINQVSADSGLTLDMPIECAVLASDAAPGHENDGEGSSDGPKEEVETDTAGNVIKKTVTDGDYIQIYEYTSEGYPVSHTEYFPDGTVRVNFSRVVHGTNPLTYTETNEWGDIYDIICDADGNPVMKGWQEPDGTLIEEWMDKETVTRRRTTQADGNIFDQEYDNNVMVKETINWADGCVQAKTYQNETLVSEVHESTLDDGRHRTSTRSYVNGELAEEIISLSDGCVDTTRYTNGVKTFYYSTFADGTYDKRAYNESGLLIYMEGYIAAWGESHNTTYTVGANGKYTYSIYKSNDGFVEENFYDTNGNKATWKATYADGRIEQGTFDANGNYVR